MPNQLTRPGMLAYAAITALVAVQTVRLTRLDGLWGNGQTWAAALLFVVMLGTTALFAVATVTRIPLVGDGLDGDRLLTRYGWAVVIGLNLVALGVTMVSSFEETGLWPSPLAILGPFGVRKLEHAYAAGVAEARLAAEARQAEARPDDR